MGIIFTIIILGIIVFIHELGHFATAKYFGMPVTEFAIGMGPRLFSVLKECSLKSLIWKHLRRKEWMKLLKN